MRRRYATIGFIAEASHALHKMVGVLSGLECGAAMSAVGTVIRRVASWIMRAMSSRLECVIVPLRFVDETKSAIMSIGQV